MVQDEAAGVAASRSLFTVIGLSGSSRSRPAGWGSEPVIPLAQGLRLSRWCFESIVTARVELQRLGHASTVGRVALGEQRDLPALDLIRHALHRRGDVVEQALLLLGAERPEQAAGLRVVVIPVAVVV